MRALDGGFKRVGHEAHVGFFRIKGYLTFLT